MSCVITFITWPFWSVKAQHILKDYFYVDNLKLFLQQRKKRVSIAEAVSLLEAQQVFLKRVERWAADCWPWAPVACRRLSSHLWTFLAPVEFPLYIESFFSVFVLTFVITSPVYFAVFSPINGKFSFSPEWRNARTPSEAELFTAGFLFGLVIIVPGSSHTRLS